MHCVQCHQQVSSGTRYCQFCGARLKQSFWRPTARLLTIAGLVAVVVLASQRVYNGLQAEQQLQATTAATTVPPTAVVLPTSVAPVSLVPTTLPPAAVTTTLPPSPPVAVARVLAAKPTAATTNACGQVDTFDAAHLQDNDFSTAWRVKGKGVGQMVQLRLAAPTRVTEVGLVPGWAKVDGCDGADLFRQHRTIAKVRWVFDGGVVVEQALTPTPDLQVIPVDAVTRNVTLQILATNEPQGINMTAISEVRVGGVPA